MTKNTRIPRALLKTVAGMAVSKPDDLIKMAAHAGDLMIKRQFAQALTDTYVFFMNKGQIKEEYFDSSSFGDLAAEFGEIYDGRFGQYKLNELRKIFANLAKDNAAHSHEKYLLDIAIRLTEPEIKTLLGDHRLAQESVDREMIESPSGVSGWSRIIAEKSGLKHEHLVKSASRALIDEGLMTPNTYSDQSGITWTPGAGRLTTMGVNLCQLLTLEDDPFTGSSK